MGILGIKSMARCRITSDEGVEVVAGKMKHMPEDMQEKRLKMYTHPKYCTWYNPEDDPEWAKKLFAFSLSKGITVAISPGHVDMFEVAMVLERNVKKILNVKKNRIIIYIPWYSYSISNLTRRWR